MCRGSAPAVTYLLSISVLISQTCSKVFFWSVQKSDKTTIIPIIIGIKEIGLAKVDKAMTKMNQLYQKQDLIPVKHSLVAAQKKVKRVEVLLSS
jgi:hypothetical protein